MKNKMSDLNDHLFCQIERLGEQDLKGEALVEEIRRAGAVCGVAQQIIAGGRLVLDAVRTADEIPGVGNIPLLLEVDHAQIHTEGNSVSKKQRRGERPLLIDRHVQ
jgi:hypothetical protein